MSNNKENWKNSYSSVIKEHESKNYDSRKITDHEKISSSLKAVVESFSFRQECLQNKQYMESAYSDLLNALNYSMNSVASISASSKMINEIKKPYLTAISQMIDECRNQLNLAMKTAIWDKLVIAFVGVTNAGKSTIIETFRILFDEPERKQALLNNPSGVDGDIIGDGSPDFTKVYKEYNMTIMGNPFVLIDVPGIEGDENSVRDEICKALGKAHCVFYVQGEGKKPDSKTVEKIKKYLKDWVKVYSIYNVRGTAFNYDEEEERAAFKTNNVLAIESQIEKVFKDALEEKYAGNITLQARLALCSVAKFSLKQGELIEEQKNFNSYFGSSKAVYDFSNFSCLTSNVDFLSKHFSSEIFNAHKCKLHKLSLSDLGEIRSLNKTYSDDLKKLEENIRKFRSNVKGHFATFLSNVENEFRCECNKLFEFLESEGCGYIDLGYDEKKLTEALENAQKESSGVLEYNLNVIVSNEADDLSNNLLREQNKLKENIKSFGSNFYGGSVDINVNIDDVLNSLSFGFGDLINWGVYLSSCFAVGWTIAAGANWWNPVGWGIGALVALYTIFGDSKKEKAKAKYREKLSDVRHSFFCGDYINIINNIKEQVELKYNLIDEEICLIQHEITDFECQIECLQDKLGKFICKIN